MEADKHPILEKQGIHVKKDFYFSELGRLPRRLRPALIGAMLAAMPGFAQAGDLPLGQVAKRSGGQLSEANSVIARPSQLEHRVAHGLEHPSDDVLPALDDRHLEPAIGSGFDHSEPGRDRPSPIDRNSARESLHRPIAGMATDPDLKSLHGDPEFEAIVEEIEKRIEAE